MLRRLLLSRITDLPRRTPGGIFVLLWDYFLRTGLSGVENELRDAGIERCTLKMHPENGSRQRCIDYAGLVLEELRSLRSEPERFDLLALRWLKRLDRELRVASGARYSHVELQGLGDATFLLKPRNNWLADLLVTDLEKGPPGTKQGDSPSFFPYCLNFMAVPMTQQRGRRIESLVLGRQPRKWASGELESLLVQESEEEHFSVLLYPFTTSISYAGLRLRSEHLKPVGFTPVRLAEIENEEEVVAEARSAVQLAGERRATVLLFPELSASEPVVAAVQEELSRDRRSRWPLLTLLGTCHRAQRGRANDVNEAILLGPHGSLLHRHRKVTNYTDEKPDGEIGERIDVGDTITVLESPLGNFVPLICLDLFHDSVRPLLAQCHGNAFLVPSLSPKTSAHREAARQYWRQRWVSTFVCNRWLAAGTPQHRLEQSSFVRPANREKGEIDHWPRLREVGSEQPRRPFLFFDLR